METSQLELAKQVTSSQDSAVVKLEGKLVLESVHNFLRTMRAETAKTLILDMSSVKFIDSAGVGALTQLFVHRRGLNQKFGLAELAQQGRAVMEVCGLPKLIPCYASVAEAHEQIG